MMSRCGHHRCSNPAAVKYYIERGITVTESWRTFIPFKDWALANGYAEDLTLDRIRSDGNYDPSNCQWISMAENLRKRSGVTMTMAKAREVRERKAKGERVKDLASEYRVMENQIYRIVRGEQWSEAGA
jgi:hypothetical protein